MINGKISRNVQRVSTGPIMCEKLNARAVHQIDYPDWIKFHYEYTYKIMNRTGQWLGRGAIRGNLGSIGMNSKFEKQYVVSVKKKNSEYAKYWVNSVLH